MNPHRRTYAAKPAEVRGQRAWWVVDAEGVPLGRLASMIATKLRGKDKPIFTPHVDTGDFVIVVNAAKTLLTGNKLRQKKYYRHSAFPGGLHQITYDKLMVKKPEFVVLKAVKGMLPKNRLGRQLLKKLKVYAGPDHPHTAQQPKPLSTS
jgi:large subunit ribosomal protein L13